jgi:hypothetical protein
MIPRMVQAKDGGLVGKCRSAVEELGLRILRCAEDDSRKSRRQRRYLYEC